MADLDILRPEVREAIERCDKDVLIDNALTACAVFHCDAWHYQTVRAELLRLASVEAELATARDTIKRLNRRVQVAEAGVAEKVKTSAPGSLGRALANAAADMFMHERDEAQAELAALKARVADAPIATLVYGQGDMLAVISAENADDWAGKHVRLVVEE